MTGDQGIMRMSWQLQAGRERACVSARTRLLALGLQQQVKAVAGFFRGSRDLREQQDCGVERQGAEGQR